MDQEQILSGFYFHEKQAQHKNHVIAGGEFHGHVDYGDGNVSSEEATHALVFMAVCLNSSWKLPIAHFFTSSITSEIQANLLSLATSYLSETGAIITNITCDNAATNLATIRLLGGNVSSHTNLKISLDLLNVLNIPILVILDPCHILKLVRGTFHDCHVIYSTETSAPAKWQHIASLHELQSEEGLHLGNGVWIFNLWICEDFKCILLYNVL